MDDKGPGGEPAKSDGEAGAPARIERMLTSPVRVKISKPKNPLELDNSPTSTMFMPQPGRVSARRASAKIAAASPSHLEFLAEHYKIMEERRRRITNEINRRSERKKKREMQRKEALEKPKKQGEEAVRIVKRPHTGKAQSEEHQKRKKENTEKDQDHIVTSKVHLETESPSSEVAVINPSSASQTEAGDVFCDLLLGDLQGTNFEDPNAGDELAHELLKKTQQAHRSDQA